MSGFCELIPTRMANTEVTFQALLGWIKLYGVNLWWVSDQGFHSNHGVNIKNIGCLTPFRHGVLPVRKWNGGGHKLSGPNQLPYSTKYWNCPSHGFHWIVATRSDHCTVLATGRNAFFLVLRRCKLRWTTCIIERSTRHRREITLRDVNTITSTACLPCISRLRFCSIWNVIRQTKKSSCYIRRNLIGS